MGLIKSENDLQEYFSTVENFVEWCERHFLQLNVSKTKEIVFDFRIKDSPYEPILINDQTVQRVNQYKYLGIIFDEDLSWEPQVKKVHSKINQRLHLLRKLNTFHVDNTLLILFFNSCIQSIYSFCIVSWGGNCAVKEKNKINAVIKRSEKIIKTKQLSRFDELFHDSCVKKLASIIKDATLTTHPVFNYIIFFKQVS